MKNSLDIMRKFQVGSHPRYPFKTVKGPLDWSWKVPVLFSSSQFTLDNKVTFGAYTNVPRRNTGDLRKGRGGKEREKEGC